MGRVSTMKLPHSSVTQRVRSLRTKRGAALTEYTVLVGTVALVCSAALITLGVALVNSLDFDRTFLLNPFP
jgi:Flp pilus assembly pilin Flp